MLAALINVPANLGYPLLFALVGGESAGALIPGETALIVAAALASQGKLSFPLVIAVAAGAAIIGDNVGYLIGRRGLRRLVNRPGRLAARRQRLIKRGEEFFARWGAAAVFFGRWLPGLRVVTSWLAGAERMHWPALPALERPRRYRLGEHDRLSRLRSRAQRLGLAGSDRLHWSRRRSARLPDHIPPPPFAAPPAVKRRGRGALGPIEKRLAGASLFRLRATGYRPSCPTHGRCERG